MPVYETFPQEGEAVVETLGAVFEGFVGEGDPLGGRELVGGRFFCLWET